MQILFTGASSFTGTWFVEELVRAGHTVICPIKSPIDHYTGVRLKRIERLASLVELVFECPFASEKFYKLLESKPQWDLFCHHAADVTNYKSPDFDAVNALANNTNQLKAVLMALKKRQCARVLLTGSVFEQREGAGSDNLRAVSPYGLSKGLTSDMFSFYCAIMEMKLAKFVIPNPFGPFEEFRFTSFLIQNWFAGQPVFVSMPAYVRDNVPVTLLAKAYADFASHLDESPGFVKLNPSYYPEAQGAFTARFAMAMRPRLSLPCDFELGVQTEFAEPKVRINTDLLQPERLHWSESAAWDELAAYYESSKPALVS